MSNLREELESRSLNVEIADFKKCYVLGKESLETYIKQREQAAVEKIVREINEMTVAKDGAQLGVELSAGFEAGMRFVVNTINHRIANDFIAEIGGE